MTIFRKNQQHQQSGLFETVEQLPERHRLRLENSWGGAFYRQLFCRIDETLFAKLYSEKPSRPNTPINLLVGMEILKSGFRWSDEDLYDAYLFDLQARYALGLRDFASGHFELRTLYNFRHRLSAQMRTVSSRQPGRQPIVIAGVCTECLNGLEPRRADLSQSLISGQGCPNPSSSPGPPAGNAMAAT